MASHQSLLPKTSSLMSLSGDKTLFSSAKSIERMNLKVKRKQTTRYLVLVQVETSGGRRLSCSWQQFEKRATKILCHFMTGGCILKSGALNDYPIHERCAPLKNQKDELFQYFTGLMCLDKACKYRQAKILVQVETSGGRRLSCSWQQFEKRATKIL